MDKTHFCCIFKAPQRDLEIHSCCVSGLAWALHRAGERERPGNMYTHERLKRPTETQKKKKNTRLLLALFESWETNSEEEKNTPSSRRNRRGKRLYSLLELCTPFPRIVYYTHRLFSLSAAQLFAYTRIAPSLHLPASTFLDPIVCAGGHLLASPRTNAVFQQRITYWGLTNRFGLSVPTYSSPPSIFLPIRHLKTSIVICGAYFVYLLYGVLHTAALCRLESFPSLG